MSSIQEADVAPASQVGDAVPSLHKSAVALLERWKQIEATDVAPLKQQLGISDLRNLVPAGEPSMIRGVNKDED
jgi:hypothetical protein